MAHRPDPIPAWQLYGEDRPFPDLLHVERIVDRAEGLDWVIAPHRHLHLHQCFLLTSGTVAMTLDGRRHDIARPTVVNVPRGTVHGFTFAAGTEGFVLTLPAADHPDLFTPGAEAAAALAQVFLCPADPAVVAGFQGLSHLHAAAGPLRRTGLRGAALGLMAAILNLPGAATGTPSATDPRFHRLEAEVRARLRQKPSVAALSHALAISPRHLSRICRAATGLSAQDYIEAQMIREACRLLVYTRMPVQQVAWQLGFDDPSYFSRAFQRSMRLSPRAYRTRFEEAGLGGTSRPAQRTD